MIARRQDWALPNNLWSSTRWSTRHIVQYPGHVLANLAFTLIVGGVAYMVGGPTPTILAVGVWLSIKACVYVCRVIDGGCIHHHRPVYGLCADGHLFSFFIPTKVDNIRTREIHKTLNDNIEALGKALSRYAIESPAASVNTTLKVMERVAEVETILRDPDTIKMLDSSSQTLKQEVVVDQVNRIISKAATFIESETAKITSARVNETADYADESINLILEGKNLSQETQERVGSRQGTNHDSAQDYRTASIGETINPDSDNIWETPDETLSSADGVTAAGANYDGDSAYTFGAGFRGSCVQINQGDGAVQSMVIRDGRVVHASQTNKS